MITAQTDNGKITKATRQTDKKAMVTKGKKTNRQICQNWHHINWLLTSVY
jgi:hypothetical protein